MAKRKARQHSIKKTSTTAKKQKVSQELSKNSERHSPKRPSLKKVSGNSRESRSNHKNLKSPAVKAPRSQNRKSGKKKAVKGQKTPLKKKPKRPVSARSKPRKRRPLNTRGDRIGQLFRDILVAAVVTLILAGLGFSLFFRVTKVAGYGMMPTLKAQDLVLVRKTDSYKRFDLVVFRNNKGDLSVRRLVGLPDEKIDYQDDTLYVDDEPIDEKFIVDEINESQLNGSHYTDDFSIRDTSTSNKIAEGYYLVLGDNRPYATDSRHYGLIKEENIIGVVKMRILPLNDLTAY